MNTTAQTGAPHIADRDQVVARLIDAPAALVFNAWIEPKQLEHWWGPNGFQTTVHAMEVRPEGITRLVMHGPDGVDYPKKLVYTEIVAAKVLSYIQSDDSGSDNDQAGISVAVRFEEEGHQTRVTVHGLQKNGAGRDRMAKEVDAICGTSQMLERLEKFLKEFLPPHR